jgi:hypothetical protein
MKGMRRRRKRRSHHTRGGEEKLIPGFTVVDEEDVWK